MSSKYQRLSVSSNASNSLLTPSEESRNNELGDPISMGDIECGTPGGDIELNIIPHTPQIIDVTDSSVAHEPTDDGENDSGKSHTPEICIPHHNHDQYRLQQALVKYDKMNKNRLVSCVSNCSIRRRNGGDRSNIYHNFKSSNLKLGTQRAKLGEFVNIWDDSWTDNEIFYVYSHYLTQPRINSLENISHDIASIASFAYAIPMDIWKTIVTYELGSKRVELH